MFTSRVQNSIWPSKPEMFYGAVLPLNSIYTLIGSYNGFIHRISVCFNFRYNSEYQTRNYCIYDPVNVSKYMCITPRKNFFIFTYMMKILMVFLIICYLSWRLSYFYDNLQHVRQTMQCDISNTCKLIINNKCVF